LWKVNPPGSTVEGFLDGIDPSTSVKPVVMNQALYFYWDGALWKSDGTPAGTQEITAISATDQLIALDDEIVFENGSEVWRSDGTASGTESISELRLSSVDYFTEMNGILFFRALSDEVGWTLWRY